MNVFSIPAMVFSSQHGWPEIARRRPSIVNLFLFMVLPLSCIPPAMLYYAGTNYGDDFMIGYANKPWGLIASVFFIAEILSFFLMGWVIKKVANYTQSQFDHYEAFILAGIAPIPLWLSAFGLLIPNLLFNIFLAVVALACSCGLIYHGIFALQGAIDEFKAQFVTYVTISAGLITWLMVMFIVIWL